VSPRVLVSGSLDRTLKVWDVRTGRHVATLFGHLDGVWCLRFDTLHIVSGSQDGRILVRRMDG
jgi:F-box and WD-40 domain protein MET30